MMIIVCYQKAGILHGCFFFPLFSKLSTHYLFYDLKFSLLMDAMIYDWEAGPSFSGRLDEDEAKA